jgi:hypothetical protein
MVEHSIHMADKCKYMNRITMEVMDIKTTTQTYTTMKTSNPTSKMMFSSMKTTLCIVTNISVAPFYVLSKYSFILKSLLTGHSYAVITNNYLSPTTILQDFIHTVKPLLPFTFVLAGCTAAK